MLVSNRSTPCPTWQMLLTVWIYGLTLILLMDWFINPLPKCVRNSLIQPSNLHSVGLNKLHRSSVMIQYSQDASEILRTCMCVFVSKVSQERINEHTALANKLKQAAVKEATWGHPLTYFATLSLLTECKYGQRQLERPLRLQIWKEPLEKISQRTGKCFWGCFSGRNKSATESKVR